MGRPAPHVSLVYYTRWHRTYCSSITCDEWKAGFGHWKLCAAASSKTSSLSADIFNGNCPSHVYNGQNDRCIRPTTEAELRAGRTVALLKLDKAQFEAEYAVAKEACEARMEVEKREEVRRSRRRTRARASQEDEDEANSSSVGRCGRAVVAMWPGVLT